MADLQQAAGHWHREHPSSPLGGATGPSEPSLTLPATTCGLCTAGAGWDVKHSTEHYGTAALIRRWWVSSTSALITQILLKSLFHQPQCVNLEVGGFFLCPDRCSYYSVLRNSIKKQNNCYQNAPQYLSSLKIWGVGGCVYICTLS